MCEVVIRPLMIEDADISWQWRNDLDVWKFTGSKPDMFITVDIEKKWIVKAIAEKTSKRFAIIADGIYVGNIQLTNITDEDAEYHIFVGDKKFWGKSIGFSASQQLIRYAKDVLKLRSIYLNVNKDHLNAIKLYDKIGFKIVTNEIKMILELNNV